MATGSGPAAVSGIATGTSGGGAGSAAVGDVGGSGGEGAQITLSVQLAQVCKAHLLKEGKQGFRRIVLAVKFEDMSRDHYGRT